MRHSIKRISKSALSVILALMMIVSTMVVGIVSVNANTDGYVRIYFDNSSFSYDSVAIHHWKEGVSSTTWPGDEMTKIGASNTYTKEITTDHDKIIFNNNKYTGASQSKTISVSKTSVPQYYSQGDKTVDAVFHLVGKIKGEDKWNSSDYELTYSNGEWSTEIDLNADDEFQVRLMDNWDLQYGGTGSGDNYKVSSAGKYKISFTDGATNKSALTVTEVGGSTSTDWYLSGWLNPTEPGIRNAEYKFTQSSSDPDIYTFTYNKQGGDMYVTINDGSKVYHADKYDADSGTVASNNTDTSPNGNNKWKVPATSGANVTFTWNAYTKVLSYVVASDYKVSVEARYKAYNNSNQSYDAATETPSDLNATFTVNGGSTATVSPNTPVTLSASTTNNDKYTFAGWYTDADCTSQVTLSDSTVTPTANTTYYALYKQNTKTITYNVEPSALNGAGFTNDSVKTAGVGSEVSVSAKTVTGYTSNITATGATISGGKFTVGNSDVTVTAKYYEVAKELCSVSVNANDSSLGTATRTTSDSIYVGDKFTVTATANPNCAFTSWTADGAEQVSTSTSGNVTSATFRATAQSVTITANFNTSSYSVHTSSGDIVMTPYASDSNVLYSTDTVASGAIFRIKRTLGTEEKYSVCSTGSGDTWYFNNTSDTDKIIWGDNSNVSEEKKGNYKNNANGAYYVMFDVSTGKVSLSETNDGTQSIKVYAKNGTSTTVDNNLVGTYLNGVTVATAANESSTVTDTNANSTGYKVYKVSEGSVVKVTTTVNDDYATDYYVHAFVINGKTYSATAGTGNSYYTEFAVEEGVANYEVTPIYYVKDCKTEGNYITFYVDASEMGEDFDWGNTISSYAYAYTGGADNEANEPDGNYPGQPMLYDEGQGRFYSRVPKVMGGKDISGITINNYKNDTVHASLNNALEYNEQSYDFNDFKKIYDLKYDIIRFDMKPRSGATNNSDLIGNAFDYYTYASNNGWEAFVDNNGNKVDVLGNPYDSANANKLYVVSSYQGKVDGVGQWSTKWTVYNQNGEKLAEGLPSDFIPRPDPANNTPAYNNITDAYKGAETEITFENRRDVDNNKYYRLDGRWFYAMSSSEVSADVKYRTSNDGTTYGTPVEEASYVTINDAASVTFEKHGETIRVVARPIKGYVFSHWSIADAGYTTFRDLSKTLGSSFTTTLDSERHYVANYIKATDGNLVLSHLKYDGSDAKGGMGYYLIEAEIFDANGQSKGVVKGTGNGANGQSIKLTKLSSSDSYIRVTITTVTSGENTFRYWYTQSSNGFEIIDDLDGIRTVNGTELTDGEDPFGAQGTVTYTFETEVWKMFSGTTQIMSEFNFYSDIAPVSKDYTLTYKYKDRFGNDKIYVVKGTHPDSYYTEYKSWAPTQKLIYDNAPAIDDLYKDCTWTMTKCTKDGADATIEAVQEGKNYDVTIYNPDGTSNSYSLPINSYVKNNLGKFYAAPSTYNNKNFSYWEVKENGVEVARHFYSEYTLVVLGDYEITPIYGEAAKDAVNISKPQYTREQTTDANGDVKTDRLYVDFMVAYMSSNPDNLIRNDASGSKYQTGVIIEIGQNQVLGTKEDGSVNPDYSGITYKSNLDTVKQAANTANGDVTKYAYDTSDKRKLYNFRATNTNYNNMNRLDYAVQFVNTDKNQKYVMKAYYYVIVEGEVILSNEVYFNLYKIGNSTPNKEKTTA